MKISVFTGKYNQTKRERWAALKSAATMASKRGSKLLILPGWSMLRKREGGIDKIKELSKKNDISILFDTRGMNEAELGKAYIIYSNKNLIGPFNQLFHLSDEVEKSPLLVKNLIRLLKSGKRSFNISGTTFSVLLCGENNFLKNIQNCSNKAIVRHEYKFDTSCYDVLINQSHTTMGNWPKLIKRFELLSRNNKYLIFLVNNDTSSDKWKSAINIFYNGKRIMTGDFEKGVGKQKNIGVRSQHST
ncbi:MAG: hypothetical protein JRJ38_10520 [Deltaproteobacteria bacterium]|nr:hypothetical protein [Deltaproteobacteria bacterium]